MCRISVRDDPHFYLEWRRIGHVPRVLHGFPGFFPVHHVSPPSTYSRGSKLRTRLGLVWDAEVLQGVGRAGVVPAAPRLGGCGASFQHFLEDPEVVGSEYLLYVAVRVTAGHHALCEAWEGCDVVEVWEAAAAVQVAADAHVARAHEPHRVVQAVEPVVVGHF